MTYSQSTDADTIDLVQRTLSALRGADLPLDMPGSRELAESRLQLITQLESRILPHLESSALPTVIVFGGSSGAGKSTLVNSIVGEDVTLASVLRPTTRTPVIVLNPADEKVMENHALGKLGKYEVRDSAIQGIALVDAPDLDSVDASNRELSARLLDSADLWVFVTTAARYGDNVAWATLSEAKERGMTCAVVLDRVPERARTLVRADLVRRMGELGLEEAPLFIVPDVGPLHGRLPKDVVAELREWLAMIARTKVGNALAQRTTDAMLPALRRDLLSLADAVEGQEIAIVDLKDKAVEAVHPAMTKLATNIEAGRFGQGAPTAAWLALASTGGPLASLVAGRKPSIFDKRKAGIRDNAATSIFDSVYTSARVALTQGVVSGREEIDRSWEADVVDTTSLRRRAAELVDVDSVVDTAMEAWKADLAKLGKKAGPNDWLGAAGNAALIGVAAGGVAGAVKAANMLGMEISVREARKGLADHVREALDTVVGAYTDTISNVAIGDSQTLRLRASEFLDRA